MDTIQIHTLGALSGHISIQVVLEGRRPDLPSTLIPTLVFRARTLHRPTLVTGRIRDVFGESLTINSLADPIGERRGFVPKKGGRGKVTLGYVDKEFGKFRTSIGRHIYSTPAVAAVKKVASQNRSDMWIHQSIRAEVERYISELDKREEDSAERLANFSDALWEQFLPIEATFCQKIREISPALVEAIRRSAPPKLRIVQPALWESVRLQLSEAYAREKAKSREQELASLRAARDRDLRSTYEQAFYNLTSTKCSFTGPCFVCGDAVAYEPIGPTPTVYVAHLDDPRLGIDLVGPLEAFQGNCSKCGPRSIPAWDHRRFRKFDGEHNYGNGLVAIGHRPFMPNRLVRPVAWFSKADVGRWNYIWKNRDREHWRNETRTGP